MVRIFIYTTILYTNIYEHFFLSARIRGERIYFVKRDFFARFVAFWSFEPFESSCCSSARHYVNLVFNMPQDSFTIFFRGCLGWTKARTCRELRSPPTTWNILWTRQRERQIRAASLQENAARCALEYFYKKIHPVSRGRFLERNPDKVWRVFLLAIHSHLYTTLPWDLYLFKPTQPLTVI